MRVLIIAPGGRGDTQPLVALGKKLADSGHDVVFACPPEWCQFAKSYGLSTVPLNNWSPAVKQRRKILSASIIEKSRALSLILNLDRFLDINKSRLEALAKVGSCGADLIVHHVFIPGHALAEAAGVPAVPVTMVPCWVPTRSFPNPWFPFVPKRLNHASYRICLPRWATELGTTRWRQKTLGLPTWQGHRNVIRRPGGKTATVLQALSGNLLPQDVDYPPSVHTTGYWFLPAEEDRTPPAALSDFISAGSRPICVCFGSSVGADPKHSARIIADAIQLAGVRAIVVGGSGGISPEELGDEIHFVEQVPFDWLFPRMATVVHHGGMGTAGLALIAGRPQVICPFHPGQQFTANRLKELGVAGEALPQGRLTPEALAKAINQTVSHNSMANNATRVASPIRNEHGLETAVKILESLVQQAAYYGSIERSA